MELEDQVCSLKLSIKLWRLGIKQKSYFYWSAWHDHPPTENSDCHEAHWQVTNEDGGNYGTRYSAFTVAELGEMISINKLKYIEMKQLGEDSIYFQLVDERGRVDFEEDASTEADVRAHILIYLLENKLITL